MHGGSFPGSAGCIDFMDEASFMNFIKNNVTGPINLEVDYPPGYTGVGHPFLNAAHNYPYDQNDQALDIISNARDRLGNINDSVLLKILLGGPLGLGFAGSVIGAEIAGKFSSSINASSPLVLDLDGDGLELSQLNQTGTVYWDGDVDGFREASAWVKPDDGLLVRDVNANGKIDNNSELFGNNATYANGFLNLKSLDSNNSNTITSADAQWGSLKVWKDTNQDGVSQSSELYTLSSLGITQINLNYSNSTTVIAGNEIKQTSTFVQNGVTKTIVDAWFANDQVRKFRSVSSALISFAVNDNFGELPVRAAS